MVTKDSKKGVTKDPKAQERGKKGWQTQLERIKAEHLAEIKNSGSDTGSTGSATGSSTTIGLYGGIVILVGAGIAVYFYAFGGTRRKAPLPELPKTQPKKYMD